MPQVNDQVGGFPIPGIKFTTAAYSSSTASAGDLSGPTPIVIINNSGGTPGSLATRTAAQMIADSGLAAGSQYLLIVVNGQGTGTLTLTGGSNVTISGTATIATNTARFYSVVVNSSATAITITNLGMSFTATALAFGT